MIVSLVIVCVTALLGWSERGSFRDVVVLRCLGTLGCVFGLLCMADFYRGFNGIDGLDENVDPGPVSGVLIYGTWGIAALCLVALVMHWGRFKSRLRVAAPNQS